MRGREEPHDEDGRVGVGGSRRLLFKVTKDEKVQARKDAVTYERRSALSRQGLVCRSRRGFVIFEEEKGSQGP